MKKSRSGAEVGVDADSFHIRLKFWNIKLDEFIMLTPTAARALFEDGLKKVEQVEAAMAIVKEARKE